MNWDAIGAIAELLGAIGVIASLVYLATQIRQSREQMSQNTRAVRASTYVQTLQREFESGILALTVPGMDRIVRLGWADYEQLNEQDRWRFDYFVTSMMMQHDNYHYQFVRSRSTPS